MVSALTTFSRPGAANSVVTTFDDRRTHFLTLFGGEIMEAFARKTQLGQITKQKTITFGKSAEFPALGRATAVFHAPGNSLVDDSEIGQIDHVKRPISLDDKSIAATFIDEAEEDMTEYEVRAAYANKLGEALAVDYDERAYIMLARAARTVSGTDPEGRLITSMGTAGEGGFIQADFTTSTSFYNSIEQVAALMDAKDVPSESRFLPLLPGDYYYLLNNKDSINRDFGGTGIIEQGQIMWAAGMRVFMSNNIPQASVGVAAASPNNTGNTYTGNFAVDGLVGGGASTGVGTASRAGYVTTAFHSDVIGSLWLNGLELETEYSVEYQGTFIVAKLQKGTNVLRPEAAVELATYATQSDLSSDIPA